MMNFKMMKISLLYIIIILFIFPAGAEDLTHSSKISSVKLYQNQAKIVRNASLSLKKGENKVILSGLPPLLYDWSVKGSLPKNFNGKILSLEVEKKALIKKRQKRILKIENKLDELREKDQVLLDDLKNINSQEKFLNSILEFTNQTVSKELATRIPQISVWDNTLNYVSSKKNMLLKNKRAIEKNRETIGKEIQRWEFELTQIAGYSYFRNYQSLNKVTLENRSAMNVQQFADISEKYAQRNELLQKPTDKVEYEKRLILSIYSKEASDVNINFSYIIPSTYWQMKYDIRASNEKKRINMIIYGNIYQKTEENWKNINLSLSTGSPVNAIEPPVLTAWTLDVYSYQPGEEMASGYSNKKFSKEKSGKSLSDLKAKQETEKEVVDSNVEEKGPYFEITLPLKQTILSSNKYQKKYIKEYNLKGGKNVKFYYELIPANVRNAFLKVMVTNTTSLPWLPGEAQIFLENEFMGKVSIPFTPPRKKEDLVLGIESRITAEKEQIKKYEDTAGIFGGKRRILYKYKITVENQLPGKVETVLLDAIPVSRNKKIQVEIQNLSLPFYKDEEFEKTSRYGNGIRKWKLNLNPGEKKEITYEVIIAFDKDSNISGLR